MSDVKHSPLPWAQGDGTNAPDDMILMDADGLGIADFAPSNPDCSTDRARANARLARTAVNSHARLVECLDNLRASVAEYLYSIEEGRHKNVRHLRNHMRSMNAEARVLLKELSHDKG